MALHSHLRAASPFPSHSFILVTIRVARSRHHRHNLLHHLLHRPVDPARIFVNVHEEGADSGLLVRLCMIAYALSSMSHSFPKQTRYTHENRLLQVDASYPPIGMVPTRQFTHHCTSGNPTVCTLMLPESSRSTVGLARRPRHKAAQQTATRAHQVPTAIATIQWRSRKVRAL